MYFIFKPLQEMPHPM